MQDASPSTIPVKTENRALRLTCQCVACCRAAKRVRAADALQAVVQAGKRNEVGERASKAAYQTYLKLI